MAGETLLSHSQDPQAVKESLFPAQGPANLETIKGSRPTTGQMTGDIGLLQAERQAKTLDNTSFNDLEARQNTATGLVGGRGSPKGPMSCGHRRFPKSRKRPWISQWMPRTNVFAIMRPISRDKWATRFRPNKSVRSFVRRSRMFVGRKRKLFLKLYKAVDPDGTMNAVFSSARDEAKGCQSI